MNLQVWCYDCDQELIPTTLMEDEKNETVGGDEAKKEMGKFVDNIQDLFFQFFNGTLQ